MEDPGVGVCERGGEPALIMSKTKNLLHTLIHDMCMLNMAQWPFNAVFFPPVPTLIQKSIILLWSHSASLSV